MLTAELSPVGTARLLERSIDAAVPLEARERRRGLRDGVTLLLLFVTSRTIMEG